MSFFNDHLLVVRHCQLDAVRSDKVTINETSGRDTILYEDPVGLLGVVATELSFNIEGVFVRLDVRESDRTRTYRVELEDARKLHFYRRLLAQTALASYSVDERCARILDYALRLRRISRDELVYVLAPELCEHDRKVEEQYITPAYFVAHASNQQVLRLLERKLGDALYMEAQMACIDDQQLFSTVAFQSSDDTIRAGVYAVAVAVAAKVSLYHLLADLRNNNLAAPMAFA